MDFIMMVFIGLLCYSDKLSAFIEKYDTDLGILNGT